MFTPVSTLEWQLNSRVNTVSSESSRQVTESESQLEVYQTWQTGSPVLCRSLSMIKISNIFHLYWMSLKSTVLLHILLLL